MGRNFRWQIILAPLFLCLTLTGSATVIVTDGEMRRLSFQSQMTEAVDGFGAWDINAFL
jgi:hypothetical protein